MTCRHHRPQGGYGICGLVTGMIVGEHYCAKCRQQWPNGVEPTAPEQTELLTRAKTLMDSWQYFADRAGSSETIDAAAIAEQEAHNARLAEVIQYPCAHRSDEPSNREDVCCESMWTYACTLGQFGGTVSVHQCAGCGKYE